MAHFCGFIKLIFLLLMLARMLAYGATRPLKSGTAASSDLIAGNEFLKLFMGHEELEREYYNRHQVESGGTGVTENFKDSDEFDKKSAETGRTRLEGSRSLKIQGPKSNQAEGQAEDSKQQVAKVNSGSKIVFLEDYDENDAILDAEAREIDLKKEKYKAKDDYKVVSVSVSSSSSSSQRGTTTAKNRMTATTSKYDNKSYTSTKSVVTMTPRPPTATTNKPSSSTSKSSTTTKPKTVAAAAVGAAAVMTTGDNFINRSHKSEFSIEEVQPSTAKQHRHQHQQPQRKPQQYKSRKQYTRHRTYPITSVADTLEAMDSENSASTNIQNVLTSPLQQSASLRSTSTVTTTYHSGQRNVSINHDTSNLHKAADVVMSKDIVDQSHQQSAATGVDDQLLPFQTVIYHDTKVGHGPQSRSISYSSISQNVEDLKKWHQSGILAEARRNVSESLKPLPSAHQSEPSKFYSQPSKMYSEPSKFYSEPAKVYSEPAKVYGEPEKFYSEPAKVYGQPSKFYGEPSKVYSQPAKVYSEPAKTYWPVALTTSISTTTTTTTSRPITLPPTTQPPQITTIPVPNIYSASRKPAIVSRIAFGEAHAPASSTSSTPSSTTTTTARPLFGTYQRTYGHRQPPSAAASATFSAGSANNENTSSAPPSRRILFNLDRLPYDLLNAPQPSTQQHVLESNKPQMSQQQQQQPQQHQALTYQQLQQQSQQHHHNINPCLESAVSSLFSSSTLSAHPALIKQRQQHSSLSDQQHSNQNAKGLPNGDLVRCVAEIAHTATVSNGDGGANDDGGLQFTTERSNIEELFTPTPDQNYEIEESVSVMTNGRAHGIQGGGGRNSLTLPTTPPPAPHPFQPNRQRVHFGTKINGGDAVTGSGGGGGVGHLSQSFNANANANGDANSNRHRNLHSDGNNAASPDYNSYDDAGDNDDNNNDEYGDGDDGDGGRHRGSAASNGDDDDDSKVAYVVEGRNYRKYRVEEKTDDGFIVGEYGVVDHNDGNLRGVRYTADSTINRSLIQKALLTFLKLK